MASIIRAINPISVIEFALIRWIIYIMLAYAGFVCIPGVLAIAIALVQGSIAASPAGNTFWWADQAYYASLAVGSGAFVIPFLGVGMLLNALAIGLQALFSWLTTQTIPTSYVLVVPQSVINSWANLYTTVVKEITSLLGG